MCRIRALAFAFLYGDSEKLYSVSGLKGCGQWFFSFDCVALVDYIRVDEQHYDNDQYDDHQSAG
jgi:hypothetical protein